jgi:hypothetical protein
MSVFADSVSVLFHEIWYYRGSLAKREGPAAARQVLRLIHFRTHALTHSRTYPSSSIAVGSSIIRLTVTRKRTASLPSTMRWS